MEHRSITQPGRSRVRRVDDRLGLCSGQVADEPARRSFRRDGEDAADLIDRRGDAVFDVAEQRLDRREARVAARYPVAAVALEMFEEGHDELRVELFDAEAGGRALESARCELEQQHEGVAVSRPRMRAGVALDRESNAEEVRDVGGDRGHRALANRAQRSAMDVSSGGVASRYQ